MHSPLVPSDFDRLPPGAHRRLHRVSRVAVAVAPTMRLAVAATVLMLLALGLGAALLEGTRSVGAGIGSGTTNSLSR